LGADGFLDRADDLQSNVKLPPPTMPGYTLTVATKGLQLRQDLGWGLPMLRRLDALRTMLDGDAAKEMDLLLGRLSGLRAQWEKEGAATTVAAPAETQDEAIRLAKESDLPSLEKAEYANIKRLREDLANVLVADPAELKQLREALLVKAVPPSAGEQLYQVTLFQGERAVRGIWVYDYGEWGFTRRTGPHWTVGVNPDLPKLLDGLIKKHEADVPKRRIVEYDPDWGIKVCLEPGGRKILAFDGQDRQIWEVDVEDRPAASIWIERTLVITLPEKRTYQVTSGKSIGEMGIDPATATLVLALEDWIISLEANNTEAAQKRWANDSAAADEMRKWWAKLGDCHTQYDYRKWLDGAKQIGDAKEFKVGGHDYGHMHVDWKKTDQGWRIAKVWICR
jgi:hypothetical protein